ncbi:putative phosphoesterase [Polaromonas sp. CF318]|uniref:metallophosphoesterase family protein n=1 Tax=Polaromonas sp. CF318 TaxID=1144318 RepID=UPI000270E382|nr:metallophosphoesterase family protein [Polaromonas sp. CF318]EJL78926.1 putative phosphoesterase [Polaromonas sp. CF318]
MKLAAISDIHGNLPALEAVLADIERQGVDQIVNLGDILSGPLQPAETAELLMARGFPTIRGNHERQVLELIDQGQYLDPLSTDGYTAGQLASAHVDWIRSLPESLELAGGDVLLCHGTPASDLIYWLETTVPGFGTDHATGIRPATADEVRERLGARAQSGHSLVLCGHTHVPRLVQCGDVFVVNPGSVGLPAYDDEHPHPHVVENGAPHARYAIAEKTGAGWCVDLRAVPYEHLAQSRVAASRGRADWAHALATGWAARAG